MRYRIFHGSTFAAGVIAIAAGLLSVPAGADPQKADNAMMLEEVTVTAQKRVERLLDVPISITAVGTEELHERGINGLNGLNAVAPNVMFRSNPGSELISTVSIRGETTGQPAIWVDPSTGIYLDGVYLGKSQGSVMDLVDLERVEVLRGPQGTLFGRNTEAGAISFVSRKPTGEFGGSVELSGGNYGHQIAKFNVDLPRFGIASVSLAARKESMDGWARNLTGPALGAIDHEGFRLAAKLDFNDDFYAMYAFDYSNAKDTPNPTSLYSLSGWQGTFPQIFGTGAGVAGIVGRALGTAIQTAFTPYIVTSRPSFASTNGPNGNDPIYDHSKTNAHMVTLDYRLNDNNELKYTFARRTLAFNDQNDIDGTPLSSIVVTPFPGVSIPQGLSAFYDRVTTYTQTSNELQWTGHAGNLKYVGGLYYFTDDGMTNGAQSFSLFSTPPIRDDYGTSTKSKAAYGQLDWNFLDRWTATAGIRFTDEEKDGWTHRYTVNGFNGTFKCDTSTAACGTAVIPYVPYSHSWTGTTPMGALAYKLNDDVNFYARVAKGFKSGGFSSELTSTSGVTVPYNPESSVLTELGVKTRFWDGRAEVNFDVFQTKLTDQQITQLLPGTTQSQVVNAGKSTYKGFELETTFLVAEGWKVGINYGYLDAKFDKYITNPILQLPNGLYANNSLATVDAASNLEPPYAPKNTLDVNLDGRLLATSRGNLRLLLDYSYVSQTYLYASNKSATAANVGGQYFTSIDGIPSIPNLNARLVFSDIPLAGGLAEVSLSGKNLTNYDRPIQGIDFGMMRTANWETPRTWLLSVGYKFGAGLGTPSRTPPPAPAPAPAPVVAPPPPPPAPPVAVAPPPPPAPAPPREELVLKGVNFETNSAKLLPGSTAILDGVVATINQCRCGKVAIRGYTDSVGKPPYNKKLSERRAVAVKDYLEAHGVAAGVLSAEGLGEENPIATNKTAPGRAENRRVTIEFKEIVKP